MELQRKGVIMAEKDSIKQMSSEKIISERYLFEIEAS